MGWAAVVVVVVVSVMVAAAAAVVALVVGVVHGITAVGLVVSGLAVMVAVAVVGRG